MKRHGLSAHVLENPALPSSVRRRGGRGGWRAGGLRRDAAAQGELTEPREVDRLAEDAHRLLVGVEARGVLGLAEVEVELRAALEVARLLKLRIRFAGVARRLDVADELDERVHRDV